MGTLIFWWEGLGGGELAKLKKRASGACFFMSGGSGKAEHVKHTHLGMFYVFGRWDPVWWCSAGGIRPDTNMRPT